MDPLYYWRKEWDRVLIRPEDLRAISHQLSAGVGQASEGEKWWGLFPWHDRLQASGGGSVEGQIMELRARHKTMLALNMLIARTPEDVTLKEVLDAPTQEPTPPTRRSEWEGDGIPKVAELNLEKRHLTGNRPGATLEVWSRGRLNGNRILSFAVPHIERTVRKAPQPEPVGVVVSLLGCAVPAVLLGLDLISPALALLLAFGLGATFYFAALRAMEWLFPPLELLPDEHTMSRWQKTWRLVRGFSAAIAGVIGVLAFVLALG